MPYTEGNAVEWRIIMRRTIVNRFRDFVDFNVIQYGHEDCRPNYTIGSFVRSNHLIHYIHRGSGVYRIGATEYRLGPGDAFLIYPKDVTYYQADGDDPWEYSWVEFSGAAVETYLSSTGFSKEEPVLRKVPAGEAMLRLIGAENPNPYELYCRLMEVLAAFVSKNPQPLPMAEDYVKYALNYIHTVHYHGSISVSDLSAYVGVNRSYLCRLFKEKLGVSPKQYIKTYRMNNAARLLTETNLSIGQIAQSSGYDDQLYFSTAFRDFFGHSPSEHRRLAAESKEK